MKLISKSLGGKYFQPIFCAGKQSGTRVKIIFRYAMSYMLYFPFTLRKLTEILLLIKSKKKKGNTRLC